MGRYAGIGFMLKYITANYIALSGPASIAAMGVGAAAALFGLAMLVFMRLRRFSSIALLLAVLPALIGLWGTFNISREVEVASSLEMGAGGSPSASRYYDLQYGYYGPALYAFPAIVGLLSSILPISIWALAVTRKKRT